MKSRDQWVESPEAPELKGDALHLWRVQLDRPAFPYENMVSWLAREESERSSRFLFPEDQRRFATGRGMLRCILGSYLRQAPETVRIQYGQYGKPQVQGNGGKPAVQFNLSHSGGVAVIGVRASGSVGIDVEEVRNGIEIDELAARHFCANERLELNRAAPGDRSLEFFHQWTRKEAYLKALGLGLQIETAEIDMTQMAGEAGKPGGQQSWEWSRREFEPQEGFIGCAVVQGVIGEVGYLEWRTLPSPAGKP